MRKRKNQIFLAIREDILNNTKAYFIVLIIFAVGTFLGVMFINQKQDKSDIQKYINTYIDETNQLENGDYIGELQKDIKNNLKRFFKKGYTIVPVPLSEERLVERGFNQVEGLIEGIPYQDIFEKRDIEKQSSKTREERLSQDNAFCLKKGIDVPDKIIIVDDIYTTGSTLYHMVQLLEAIGIKEVLTFSLAR